MSKPVCIVLRPDRPEQPGTYLLQPPNDQLQVVKAEVMSFSRDDSLSVTVRFRGIDLRRVRVVDLPDNCLWSGPLEVVSENVVHNTTGLPLPAVLWQSVAYYPLSIDPWAGEAPLMAFVTGVEWPMLHLIAVNRTGHTVEVPNLVRFIRDGEKVPKGGGYCCWHRPSEVKG